MATKRASYLSISPLGTYLILKTHLHLIVFIPTSKGTKVQAYDYPLMPLCIASTQFGSRIVLVKEVDSLLGTILAIKAL